MKTQNILLAFAFFLIVGTFVSATTIGIPNQFAVDSKKNIITLSDGLRIEPHANKAFVVIENTYPNVHKIKQSGELGHLWLNVVTPTKTYPAKNEHWVWSITQNGTTYALVGTATDGALLWTQAYSTTMNGVSIKLTNTLKNTGTTPIAITGVNLVVEGVTNQNIPMTVTVGNSFSVDYSDIPRTKAFKYDGSSNGAGQTMVNGKSSIQTNIIFSGNYTIPAGGELVIDPTIGSLPYMIDASDYYDLSGDLTGANGINISAGTDDVILNCGGYKITGTNTTGSYGILANDNTNVTIENCQINGYQYGINASLQTDLTVWNNTIYGYGGASGGTGSNGGNSGDKHNPGGSGGAGGNGESAYGVVIVDSDNANFTSNIIRALIGGNGGLSGNGGNGYNSGPIPPDACSNGGSSGNGGTAGSVYALTLNGTNNSYVEYNNFTTLTAGQGGGGGTGGIGGNSLVSYEYGGCHGGSGGLGGAAGNVYSTYSSNSYLNTIGSENYENIVGKVGGNGGTGGKAGSCGYNHYDGSAWCGYRGGGNNGGRGTTVYGLYYTYSGNSTIGYELINQTTSGAGGSGGGAGARCDNAYCQDPGGGSGSAGAGGNITKFYFTNSVWNILKYDNATSYFTLGSGGTYWGFLFESTSTNNVGCGIGSNITDLDSNALSSGSCMAVTITSPTGTVIGSSATGVFNFTSAVDAQANCTRWVDVDEIANGTILEGVTISDSFSGLGMGAHTYNVTCLGLTTGDVDSQSSPFTVASYSIINASLVYSNNTYETFATYFYANISTSASIQFVTAAVWWDGVPYAATESPINYFAGTITPYLVSMNDTPISFYWNFTIHYMNGTTEIATTATQTQYIDYAAWVDSYTADSALYQEGAPSTATVSMTNLNPGSITTPQMALYLYYTNGTLIGSGATTPTTIGTRANDVDVLENRTWSGQVNFTDGLYSRTVALTPFNVSTYRIQILNCTGGNIVVENMSVYDEETGTEVYDSHIETGFTMAYTGIVYNFSFDLTGTYYKEICMWPNSSTFSASQEIWYSVPNVYAQRDYYLFGNFTNSTKDVKLYLLNASRAYITTIYVTDENNNLLPDIIVSAQRYYLGENVYKAVAQLKTDFEGRGTTVLTPNTVYYQFVLMNASDGAILRTIPPSIIVCKSGTCPPYIVNLQIKAVKIALVYSQMGKLSSVCGFNNATGMFSCTVADASGFTTKSYLMVKKKGAIDYSTVVCNTSCLSSTCTLLCPLGNSTTDSYWYGLYADMSDPENYYPLQSGFVGIAYDIMAWGIDGIIITLIVALTFFFAGAWRADVAVGMMVVGLILSWVMGFYVITNAAPVIVLGGLVIILLVTIWKSKNQA